MSEITTGRAVAASVGRLLAVGDGWTPRMLGFEQTLPRAAMVGRVSSGRAALGLACLVMFLWPLATAAADIAAQTGHLRIALDTYGAVQRRGGDLAARTLGALKRLDVATSSGDGRRATDVLAWLNDVAWSEPPPTIESADAVPRWERTLQWPAHERSTMLAQM